MTKTLTTKIIDIWFPYSRETLTEEVSKNLVESVESTSELQELITEENLVVPIPFVVNFSHLSHSYKAKLLILVSCKGNEIAVKLISNAVGFGIRKAIDSLMDEHLDTISDAVDQYLEN